MRVVVAMSGGVDSSVAAMLLQREGHEVVGVTLQVWPEEAAERRARRGGCCGLGAVRDARAVADLLGIPHYVFGVREEFHREVVARFTAAYAAGRTPNPCIACNEFIKFGLLLERARLLGAGALATGHYARTARGADGAWHLLRAADPRKDQSYVLHPLRPEDLPFVRFPLGGLPKEETRALARACGLPVADKPDSQEICFVGPEGHAALVGAEHPDAVRPGPVVDTDGRILGQHRGLAHYTVGQRRGLGLAEAQPRYVVALDAVRNTVVVGREDEVRAVGCRLRGVHWLDPEAPRAGRACRVQVRSGSGAHPAVVTAVDGADLEVRFALPVRAVTPGQAGVLYAGEAVLGGGEIDRVVPAGPQRSTESATQAPSTA